MRSWPQTETAGSSADGADESCPTEGEIGTVVLDLRPLFHFNPLTLKGVGLTRVVGVFLRIYLRKACQDFLHSMGYTSEYRSQPKLSSDP